MQLKSQKVQPHIGFYYVLALLFLLLPGGIMAVYLLPNLYTVVPTPIYLTLHTILEFLSVVVCTAVFIVAWYNYQHTGNLSELVICLTFLSLGIINFAHTLSYNGMPDFFTPNSVNKASTYWIAGRLTRAAGLFLAVLAGIITVRRKVNPIYVLFAIMSLVAGALVLIALDASFIPRMFIPGQGQTMFKIVLEYVGIAFEGMALLILLAKKHKNPSEKYVAAALLFLIFSAVAFTMYSSAYDTYNLLGHLYLIAAFVLILRGLLVGSVVKLYEANRMLEEQKRRLAAVNDQLEKVNRLKSDFLANTNHELRTPLTAIIAFTELMMENSTGPLNEIQKDYIQEINDSSQRLLVEINNLLDLSRLEAGQMKVKPECVCINEVVHQSARQLMPLFLQKHQNLQLALNEKLQETSTDIDKLKKILINLLSNANKFSPAGGTIIVETGLSADQAMTVVSVTDDGPGLEQDQIPLIFEKFQQVDSSLARRTHGSGLGLAIVKHFTELCGGQVWVKSRPGEGSTFSFSLPIKLDNEEVDGHRS